MSFILKDESLMQELLKIAQQTNQPAANLDQVKAVAQKLVNNLLAQVNQNDTFTSERENARLSTKYLVNLPTLLTFLQYNGISYRGLKLVLSHSKTGATGLGASITNDPQFAGLSPDQQKQYVKFPEPDDDEEDNFQFYIYKVGLIAYLEDLLKQAGENTTRGNMLRPYVNALVGQLNSMTDFAVGVGSQENQKENGTVSQKGENDNSPYQTAGYVTEDGKLTESGAQALANLGMPLRSDDFSSERIETFAKTFAQIYPKYKNLSDYTLNMVNSLKSSYPLLIVQNLQAPNYQEITQAIVNASGGKQASAQPYISLLSGILQGTEQMLRVVYTINRDNGSPGAQSLVSQLSDQLTNVYQRNLYSIRNLEGQMQRFFNNWIAQNRR